MAFVIYHKETTVYLKLGSRKDSFPSEGAAKAALTREAKAGKVKADDYAIADREYFQLRIEKKETRHGVCDAHGKEFVVPVNTSWTSGPWSETYWSS